VRKSARSSSALTCVKALEAARIESSITAVAQRWRILRLSQVEEVFEEWMVSKKQLTLQI
jgi:hypothetical protein